MTSTGDVELRSHVPNVSHVIILPRLPVRTIPGLIAKGKKCCKGFPPETGAIAAVLRAGARASSTLRQSLAWASERFSGSSWRLLTSFLTPNRDQRALCNTAGKELVEFIDGMIDKRTGKIAGGSMSEISRRPFLGGV